MSEFKRIKYIVINKLTNQIITDIQIGGTKDTWQRRKEAISFVQNPNNIYGDIYIIKIDGSKSQGLTFNEVWDEYEFKKYGTAKGKWIGVSPKSKKPKIKWVHLKE